MTRQAGGVKVESKMSVSLGGRLRCPLEDAGSELHGRPHKELLAPSLANVEGRLDKSKRE